nr:DapH/DapD/GlmU-related protein [Rhodopirellula sp. SM50]
MIPSSAVLGRRVTLGYWALGIVIHKDAVLGDDCWIMQNVTIGRKSGEQGVPKLGRNVAVGAGAVILGNIELGDHCVVGANSVVNRSFPACSVIAGVPAKLIRELPAGQTQSHYRER